MRDRYAHLWSGDDAALIQKEFKNAAYTVHEAVYEQAMQRIEAVVPSGRVYCESVDKATWSQAFIPQSTYGSLTDNAAGDTVV